MEQPTISLVNLAEVVTKTKAVDDSNIEEIDSYLLQTFKPYELETLPDKEGDFDVLAYNGNTYKVKKEMITKLFKGTYKLDFNFATFPKEIAQLIQTVRKFYTLRPDFYTDNADSYLEGICCLQDYLTLFLLNNFYLTDRYLENENFYHPNQI